jgi:hypothetical protein
MCAMRSRSRARRGMRVIEVAAVRTHEPVKHGAAKSRRAGAFSRSVQSTTAARRARPQLTARIQMLQRSGAPGHQNAGWANPAMQGPLKNIFPVHIGCRSQAVARTRIPQERAPKKRVQSCATRRGRPVKSRSSYLRRHLRFSKPVEDHVICGSAATARNGRVAYRCVTNREAQATPADQRQRCRPPIPRRP